MVVIEHLLSRLNDIGMTDVFGVPGDLAFPVTDAVCSHPKMQWNGGCNELNAAYRHGDTRGLKGIGAVCTAYEVGN